MSRSDILTRGYLMNVHKIVRILRWAAGPVIATALAAGMLAPAATAAASARPRVSATVQGWWPMVIEPTTIEVGEGGAPFGGKLTWSRWTSSGKATGYVYMISPKCPPPIYKCKYYRFPATVWVDIAKTHGKLVYFSHMIWQFEKYGTTRRIVMNFGPVSPFWQGWQ